MKNDVFAVWDEKAKDFGRPFVDVNVGTAIRGFAQVCKRGGDDNMYFKFPEDYKLYHLGAYDTEKGRFENFDIPHLVSSANDFKEVKSHE